MMVMNKSTISKEFNVLSTFNGMGCIWYAFDRCNIKITKRYISEINKYANQANDVAYNDSIHLGDVRNVDVSKLDKIHFYAGGSPCTDLSFAGKQSGLICNSLSDYIELRNEWLKTGNEDLYFHNGKFQESILFWEWLRILKDIQKINPDVIFLLENVKMKKQFERIINDSLGLQPVRINSNRVSAQNRDRYYWTNIRTKQEGLFGDLVTDIPQPDDKGILLKDILQPESEVDNKYYLSDKLIKSLIKHAINRNQEWTFNAENGKAKALTVSALKQNLDSNYVCVTNIGRRLDENGTRKDYDSSIPYTREWQFNNNGKSNCLTSVQKDNLMLNTNNYSLRRLTPRECGLLQTFTDDELNVLLNSGISDTQLYKMFGNGWTIDVIAWIISFMNI